MVDRIWNFPTIPVSKQLFYASGAAVEGGYTSGGARMLSPEPGGRATLELQPSLQITEWEFPLSSWIMSKVNGQIFRIRLAPTPQILSSRSAGVLWTGDVPWDNNQPWSGDLIAKFSSSALEGSTVVKIDMGSLAVKLRHGHLFGAGDYTYLVDDIEYDGNVATVTASHPFRKPIASGDNTYLRPYFLGTISNGAEIRATYDASNNGAIQIEKIMFSEVIL